MQVKTDNIHSQPVVAFCFATTQVKGIIGGLGGLQMPDAVEVANGKRIGFVEPFVRASRVFFRRPRTVNNHINGGSYVNRSVVEVKLIEVATVGKAQCVVVCTAGTVIPYGKEESMVGRNGLHHERTVGAYNITGGAVYPLVTVYVLRNFGYTHFHIGDFADIGIAGRFHQDAVSHHNRQCVFGSNARTSRIRTFQLCNPIHSSICRAQANLISSRYKSAGLDISPNGIQLAVRIRNLYSNRITGTDGKCIGFHIGCTSHKFHTERTNQFTTLFIPYSQCIMTHHIGIPARIMINQSTLLVFTTPNLIHLDLRGINLKFITRNIFESRT